MLRNGFPVCVILLTISAVVWSDEPVSPKKSVKQRVSPKLLREALALPEYQGQAAHTPAPVLLDDLQQLSRKLKKNGDNEGAELLQRFIDEQQKTAKKTSLLRTASDARINIQIQVVEVNLEGLPPDSILFEKHPEKNGEKLHVELRRLAEAKNIKLLSESSVYTRLNEAFRCMDGGEFPIPVPGLGEKVSVEFREFGTIIEGLVSPIERERIRFQLTFEDSTKDDQNSITILGITVPSVSKQRIQSTIDADFGEWALAAQVGTNTKKLFVMTRVTPAD